MLLALALVAQLAGKWWCTTAAGSAVAATFTVAPSGDVSERIEFGSASNGGWWDQTFSYDPQARLWNVKNTGSNGWVFTGTSDGGDARVFEVNGTQNEGQSIAVTRERIIVSSPQNFTHLWEKQVKGAWQLTSYSDCTKQ